MRKDVLLAVSVGLVATLIALACGGGGSSSGGTPPPSGPTVSPSGATITIKNLAFSPLEMTVDAGTVISIVNADNMAHTVTSEASDGAYTPGAVAGVSFDTGQLSPSNPSPSNPGPYGGGLRKNAATSSATITISATAPSGTVIPYYCRNHLGSMATPNGHITVR